MKIWDLAQSKPWRRKQRSLSCSAWKSPCCQSCWWLSQKAVPVVHLPRKEPPQTLESQAGNAESTAMCGLAGRTDCTCVEARRKHPDKAQIRRIRKMKHQNPKWWFKTSSLRTGRVLLRIHCISWVQAGEERKGRGMESWSSTDEKEKIQLSKGRLLQIFFRELKSKQKFAKAIKRHVSEDVYKGTIQTNFHAILPQSTKNMEVKKEYKNRTDSPPIQQIKRESYN